MFASLSLIGVYYILNIYSATSKTTQNSIIYIVENELTRNYWIRLSANSSNYLPVIRDFQVFCHGIPHCLFKDLIRTE
ncbi:hypothetical protein AFLA_007294 [Aspergillus flavus NRRL3357]|nr:hypothetical protein AFLA_007294 [Aspergillus flavus NRRL3357]